MDQGISDFIDNAGVIVPPPTGENVDAGLDLYELPALKAQRKSGGIVLVGWPICCFVPVDERENDIGDLRRAADKVDLLHPDLLVT